MHTVFCQEVQEVQEGVEVPTCLIISFSGRSAGCIDFKELEKSQNQLLTVLRLFQSCSSLRRLANHFGSRRMNWGLSAGNTEPTIGRQGASGSVCRALGASSFLLPRSTGQSLTTLAPYLSYQSYLARYHGLVLLLVRFVLAPGWATSLSRTIRQCVASPAGVLPLGADGKDLFGTRTVRDVFPALVDITSHKALGPRC